MDVDPAPAPLANVVQTIGDNASARLDDLRQRVESVGSSTPSAIITSVALVEAEPKASGFVGPTIPAFEAALRGLSPALTLVQHARERDDEARLRSEALARRVPMLQPASSVLPALQASAYEGSRSSGALAAPAGVRIHNASMVEVRVRSGSLLADDEAEPGQAPK
jgi:hypothetical protein